MTGFGADYVKPAREGRAYGMCRLQDIRDVYPGTKESGPQKIRTVARHTPRMRKRAHVLVKSRDCRRSLSSDNRMDDKVVVQNHHELTSFQPLSPEPASNSTSFLWRLFGFSRAQQKEQETQKITQPHLTASQQRQESVNRDVSTLKEKTRSPVSQPKAVPSVRRKSGSMHMHMSGHGMSGARSEITPPKRTLQTVLHTIGNMTDVQVSQTNIILRLVF